MPNHRTTTEAVYALRHCSVKTQHSKNGIDDSTPAHDNPLGAFTYYVSSEGRGFSNADATVLLTVCPSVKLLTEGGGGREPEKSC